MLGKSVHQFQTPRGNDVIPEDNRKALTYLVRLYSFSDERHVLMELNRAKSYYHLSLLTYEQFDKFVTASKRGELGR